MGGLTMLEKNEIAEVICESDKTDKLEELIRDLRSKSNDTRSDAKSIVEICIDGRKPHVFANKLYLVLSSSQDPESSTISAILLRKSLIIKSKVPGLRFPPEKQPTLKGHLLKLVGTPARPINKELCHTVSALAAFLLLEEKWPEFLLFLIELVESDKLLALLIVASLAQYLGKQLNKLHSVNSIKEKNLYKKLYSFLLQCLKTTEGEDVRIAALGAAINFILCLEQKDLVNFQDMLTAMMSTLKKALYSGNETMADAVNRLIDLAGMKPTFLRKQIVEMVKTILLMADDDSLKKEKRRLAIEFVLTLDEVEKTNPGLLKLETEFEINMEKMWEDNRETDNYGSWWGCVDGLWILPYRNDILTVALEVLPAYLAAPKRQNCHAALIALSKSIIKWKCWECLEKEKEWNVRVAALGAAINFSPCLDLLTLMLFTLEDVLKDRDEVMASEVLELLIELAEPMFLVGQIEKRVNKMWLIANKDGLNVGTRRLAIEFISKLAQAKEIAPWLEENVRKLFKFLMNTLDHINDDDYVNARERSNHWNWRWRRCLNKLCTAVIRNGMFSIVLEVLQECLEAPESQKKYNAFIMLAQSLESCRETHVTRENLEKVESMVLSKFPNAHRYVRCAAIEAIQQLLTHLLRFRLHEKVMRTNFELVMSELLNSFQDHDPVVQNASIRAIEVLASTLSVPLQVKCHLVLPNLAKVVNDSPNQDMRVRAASIILDFSEYCTPENLKKHLDGSIRSCLIVLKEVKEFVTRIRDMCSSKDMFSGEIRLSEEAWVQLWRNEERDFSPFLHTLMSPVFDFIRNSIVNIEEILMAPVFDAAGAQLFQGVTWYLGVNIIEQKAMACHVLCFCVVELKELLFPLVYEVVRTLIPFLKWYHDPPLADALFPLVDDPLFPLVDDPPVADAPVPSPECYYAKAVRIAAISAMPKILNSARKVVESSDPEDYDQAMQYVEELSDMVIGALTEASNVEPDDEVRYDILDALDACVQ